MTHKDQIVPKGTTLLNQGDFGSQSYVVKSGVLIVVHYNATGDRTIVRILGKNDILIDCYSCHYATFEVQAVTDSVVRKTQLSNTEVRSCLQREIAHLLSHRVAMNGRANRKISTCILEFQKLAKIDSKGRFLFWRDVAADYVGIRYESVSRTLTELEALGLICRCGDGHKIVIKDEAGLRALAATESVGMPRSETIAA